MYISAVSPIAQYKPIQQIKTSQVKFNTYPCDQVCFTGGLKANKFKATLYRAVDKAEVDALLSGDNVGNVKYVTTDKRGWGAKNWISGFASERNNVCFIQFKDNWFDDFDVYNACDHSRDTRYILNRAYTIDDVEVIREGANSHGKIIWARSNDIIDKDLQIKTSEIFQILKRIIDNKKGVVSEDVYELSSYINEFPNIAQPLLERVSKDKTFAYEMMYLFEKSNSQEYYPYVKNYVKGFRKDPQNCELNEYAICYMGDHGSNRDLELLFDVMKKDQNRISHSYPYAFYKLAKPKDYQMFIKFLDSPEAWMQDLMLCTIRKIEKAGKLEFGTTERLCLKTLEKMVGIPAEEFQKDASKQDLLMTCSEILFRSLVPKEYIPTLKYFTNLGVPTDADFRYIIRDLVVV